MRTEAVMRLLWETVLRITEALELTWDRIYRDGINILNGKGDKQHFAPSQAQILGKLLCYRESHQQERVLQRISSEPGTLYMMRRCACKIALGKRIHPYLFRYSFAVNFL